MSCGGQLLTKSDLSIAGHSKSILQRRENTVSRSEIGKRVPLFFLSIRRSTGQSTHQTPGDLPTLNVQNSLEGFGKRRLPQSLDR